MPLNPLLVAVLLCLLGGEAVAQELRVTPAVPASPSEQARRDGLSQRDVLEMSAVGLTGVGHLTFSALDARRLFIPLAALGWTAYVGYRARTDRGVLRRAGFGAGGLRGSFRDASLAALGATSLMAGYAAWRGTLALDRDMGPLFLLYPAWGLVQQFLVQGLFVRHLSDARGRISSPYVVTPVAAALFGMVHLPSWKLAAGTFAIGSVFTPLYLKHNNLWPLGLYHGGLGVLFYFWVLERNPWHYVTGEDPHQNVKAGVGIGAEGRPALQLRVRF